MVKPKETQTDPQPMEVLAVKQEKVLLTWRALERPYQKKDKEFWMTALSVLGLVCLILFFVKEWFLILALLALVFLYYALTTVAPKETEYKITTKGVYISASQVFAWDVLRRFWLDKKWGQDMIRFETWLNFPRVVGLVIAPDKKEEIEKTVAKYLPEEAMSPTAFDKLSSWLADKFPLETKK
ncbi:MAG: hypothetical protein ABID04_03855 [Patescibacteria group bacterium]